MLWPVNFTDHVHLVGDPVDDAHRQRNFDLCRAVDLTSLSVVLDALVKAGMPKGHADLFRAQGEALLQLMRTENNRIWADQLNVRKQTAAE